MIDHFSLKTDRDYIDRSIGRRFVPGLYGGLRDSVAARNLHFEHSDADRLIHGEDGFEFFEIEIEIIEFGASNQDDSALEICRVEIGHGEGNTIGADEDIGILEEGSIRGDEFQLHRPVRQL